MKIDGPDVRIDGVGVTLRIVASAICLNLVVMASAGADPILSVVRQVERDLDARVGFYMHDLETDTVLEHAADHRFPLSSTFKLLACGALLSRVEADESSLDSTVRTQGLEIVPYSPCIENYIKAGRLNISLEDACRMMLSVSDNTAANIVLSEIGGPVGFTAFMRSIGDETTRLDRWEPMLNEARPGDPRDTTTPQAIGWSIQQLLLGNVLSRDSRATLRGWLSKHSMADDLFRAELPEAWWIDDRTGAGGFGSRSIVAVLHPPDRRPIVVAFFMTETDADISERNAAIALVGREIVAHVTRHQAH